jgi:hypothetical protein
VASTGDLAVKDSVYSTAISLSRSRLALGNICAFFYLPLGFLQIDEAHLSPNRFSNEKLRNLPVMLASMSAQAD